MSRVNSMQKKEVGPLTERLLDTKEAAEFLKVSEMSIRRWTNSGALNCYRVGGKRERRFRLQDLEGFLHTGLSHPLLRLGYKALRIPAGSHLSHFYSGKEEGFQVSAACALSGLKNREMVLVVMPPERRKDFMKQLERRKRSIEKDLQRGRLNFSSGMDSPEEMIGYLGSFAKRSERFRVVGDMVWVLERGWDLESLVALEGAVEFIPGSERGLILCQYSLPHFSGTYIMKAAESHRHLIYKGKMEESPYYSRQINKEESLAAQGQGVDDE